MMFKKKVLATLIPLVFIQPVYADETKEAIKLDKVEVTGILPEKLESVPGSFDIVTEKELEASRPFSIKEALGNVPGVNVVQNEDPLGLAQNIGIRGMDPRRTSRTLLLEDGMPLFLAPYGDPSSHYVPMLERVGRIEVVKGSGQVLYGPQTVGGMINFVSKPVPKDGFAGSVSAVGGNNDFYGLHANVGYGTDLGGFMVDAIKKEGDGIRKNHEFDVEEYTLKGQLNITDRQTLIAKVGYYKEDSNVSETGLGEVDYINDKFQAPSGKNDFFEHERKSAQLQHIFQIDDKMKLSTQAYYADSYRTSFRQTDAPGGYDEANNATGITVLERCDTPGVPFTEAQANACGGRHRPRSYNYWGIEPRLDVSHNLFGVDSDAVLGFRYHEEDIRREQYRGDTADFQSLSFAKANSLSREDIGIKVEAKSYYAQNTFHVNDWAITPGVRVEDIQIKTDIRRAGNAVQNNPESNSTNNQTEVLPGFGVAWNGIANTTLFGGVHKGFAPPRPDRDLRVAGANTAVVDKTKPETSTNWEIGVRSNYFKGVNFSSTLFHTKFDDIVVNNGAGNFVNGGESAMSGLEVGGRIDFGTIYNTSHNIYVLGSYTNTFTAEFKKDGQVASSGIQSGSRLPYAPRHLASVSLGYQHSVGLDARVGVTYISQQEVDAFARALGPVDAALSGLAGNIPAYTLLNASVNFKPVGSKVTYFASGHNLADREYLASRVDGMSVGRGRQVFGGIRYDF
ncbi:TonB-dependent receptor [Methylotenera sp.]|uniref:TonB-dependent receptor family protein n=1 Tax=Methylotenera sp. TaxID=2051956 RepID=UPI0025F01D50|nr:TonB-dependent receptor [Methylotenera sp.]